MQIQACLTPRAQEQDLGICGQKSHVCNVNIYIYLHSDYPTSPEERSRNFQGRSHSKLKELSKIGKKETLLCTAPFWEPEAGWVSDCSANI